VSVLDLSNSSYTHTHPHPTVIMTFWRAAGLNYINYSSIAARVVRKALKPELRVDAIKRAESAVKITPWKDGKPIIKVD